MDAQQECERIALDISYNEPVLRWILKSVDVKDEITKFRNVELQGVYKEALCRTG